jgi:hypothetical protein
MDISTFNLVSGAISYADYFVAIDENEGTRVDDYLVDRKAVVHHDVLLVVSKYFVELSNSNCRGESKSVSILNCIWRNLSRIHALGRLKLP